jgi:hypothetical protein
MHRSTVSTSSGKLGEDLPQFISKAKILGEGCKRASSPTWKKGLRNLERPVYGSRPKGVSCGATMSSARGEIGKASLARALFALAAAVFLVTATAIVAYAAVPAPVAGENGSVATHGWSWGTSIADVTGDGRKDLIVTNHEGDPGVAWSLLVYPQLNGGALASSPTAYQLSGNPDGPYWEDWLDTGVGDLDGDGDNDVVVGRNGGLEIFHQSGGVLQSPVVLTTGGPIEGIAVVDLNGDGDDDLLYAEDIGNHQFTLTRRFQGAAGAFGSAVAIATVGSGRFGVGDINSDGRPDIAVHEFPTTETQILLHNAANQAFTSSTVPYGSVLSTAVADVNGDGRNDLIELQSFQLWMLAGTAGGGLAAPVVVDNNLYLASSVIAADMNADGLSDIVVYSQGGLDVFEQSAAGTLQARCPFPTITPQTIAGAWSEVAIGDLDGDGRPDAAASELDDYTRITRQIAPGSPVPTSLSIGPPGTAEIGIPFTVAGTIDAGVHGCLGAPEVDIWRQLPGGGPTLLDTVALRNNSGTTTWMFSLQDDPGQLGTVTYRATWAGDGFRDPSQSAWEATEVTKRATSLTLEPSDGSIKVGQTTTLRATLTGGEPGADVSFSEVVNGVPTPIGTVPIDGAGLASLEVSPAVSTTYRATYAGDATWAPATSTDVLVNVSKWITTLKLHPSRRLLPYGEDLTLSATLKGGSGSRSIAFYSVISGNKRLLGSDQVNANGIAAITITAKQNASYLASYKGDDTWASSSSSNELVEVHILAEGRMTRYRSKDHGVAIYNCCRAFFAFKVMPNYAGEAASIRLDVRTPDGDWQRVSTKKFKLRRNSTLSIVVDIGNATGYTFAMSGCLRDQPHHRGWCSQGALFRFTGSRAAARAADVVGPISFDRLHRSRSRDIGPAPRSPEPPTSG